MADADDEMTHLRVLEGTTGTIDVVYRYEEGSASFRDPSMRAFDVCTQNRIYGLDRHFRCTTVIDRATGHENANHRLVGAVLMGGTKRGQAQAAVSYPLPEVGMHAIFTSELGSLEYIRTSPVTRVVVRQCIMSATLDEPVVAGPEDR